MESEASLSPRSDRSENSVYYSTVSLLDSDRQTSSDSHREEENVETALADRSENSHSTVSLDIYRQDGEITLSDSDVLDNDPPLWDRPTLWQCFIAYFCIDQRPILVSISVNDNQRHRPTLWQRFMDHLFVDQQPILTTDAERYGRTTGCYKICGEISTKFPSLRTTKILIHFISLLFSIWDITTDILFYQTLRAAQDMLKFQEPYFIFLIISSFFFLAEIILCILGIFEAAKTNKKIHPIYKFYMKTGLLLCEDLPFSAIILFSMIGSGNCGYVVSMTYSKSAWWSSLATIFGCVWRLIWLNIDLHEVLDNLKRFLYQSEKKEKILVVLVMLILTKAIGTILMIFGYYLGILAILMFPVSLFFIIAWLTVLIKLDNPFEFNRGWKITVAFGVTVGLAIIFILLPLCMAFANLIFLTSLGHLANVSGCTLFTLNISASILFPIVNGSTNCGFIEYYSMKMGISGISDGDGFLANNKMIITGDCNQLLPMEFAGLYSVSSNDSCVVFASAMYSTQDFVPEFNVAFLVQKTPSYSVCVKPYVEMGNITFSTPWIHLSKTVERVGKSYCGLDNFSACSMPEIGDQDLSPCFDCDRNCYSWVKPVKKNPIIFQSLEGWLIIRGKEYVMRHNVKLATHCDVNSDWKSEKLFCSPI